MAFSFFLAAPLFLIGILQLIEEFIYVLQGDIEVKVGKEDFVLKKGDSLYFDASLSHVLSNKKAKEAQAICIVSPPQL